jgi:hypothetical protein
MRLRRSFESLSSRLWVVIGCGAMLVAGCGASEESVQREYDDFVSTRQACEMDSDCVLAGGGCPLGCGSPVNEKYADEVEQKANDLIRSYERGGRSCAYDCVSGVPVCDAGSCAFKPD